MSTFLISTMPEPGHVNPARPVAAELVRRGHRVLWHTGRAFRSTVEATGATFEPFVDALDFTQLPAIPDPATKGLAAAVSTVRRLFVDRIPGQVADYRRITARVAVDVLLTDMCALGAATLRDLGGPPFATLGINPLTTLDPEIPPWGSRRPATDRALDRARNRASHWLARQLFLRRLTQALEGERARLGLGALPPGTGFEQLQRSPFLHLMPTTLAFEYPREELGGQIHFVGPLLPAAGELAPPSWWPELERRRVVHVTQGTFATHAANLIQPTIDALAGSDLLVVVTTRDGRLAGRLPSNVRIAPYIPHAHLLPKVAVMVTNAGYNGVLAALAHGVPLVAAGESEDKAEVSARIAWSGAGIDLRTATPRPAAIAGAVHRLLADRRYAEQARRIQADFARHRGAGEAADLLQVLAETRQPVLRPAGMRAAVAARK